MRLVVTVLYLFWFIQVLDAQNPSALQKKTSALYQEALSHSQQGNPQKSIQLLNDILKLDPVFYMAYFALADLSHESKNQEQEMLYLKKGLALSGDKYPAGYKFLAEAHYNKGEYTDALKYIKHYTTFRKSLNPIEQLLLSSCLFSANAVNSPVPFQPVNPGDSINTDAQEYWPSINAEASELVFTRLETKDRSGVEMPNPQEDFFSSKLDSNGWHLARPLGPPVNTEDNEGAQTLSADGRWLIFTGCGRADGIGSCDLYFSMNRNGSWTLPVNMGEPVNSGAWESQPSLSGNGEVLYFVSSRKGSLGKMDIWKAEKIAVSPDGIPQFGNVTNVSALNTQGNDLSPFIHADGKTIYFASDGRPGMGGTDLFLTRTENDSYQEPVNLGFPINTKQNEEGLVVEISGERAWFTTDRNQSRGRDIYYFTLPDSIRPEPVSYLKGEVLDAKTGVKVSSDIILSNLKTNKVVRRISPAENQGSFLICLPSGENYGLSISRKGYLFASENISLVNGYTQKRPREISIRLKPVEAGASTTLKNIFFETNSWQLKEESGVQLEEMAIFMKNNPDVNMEVIGHTDRTGTESYNLDLSQKRAEAVVQELLKRKVEPYRIKSKGVGYSMPVGDNNSEEGRSANRRTEFSVKSVNKNQ